MGDGGGSAADAAVAAVLAAAGVQVQMKQAIALCARADAANLLQRSTMQKTN